ncbi:MAG: Ig domain-containing protein [Ekhidna sp.]
MRWSYLLILSALFGCIGDEILDDEVSPKIRIINPIETMEVNTSYQFEYIFTDLIGDQAIPSSIIWQSSDMNILTVNSSGLAEATSLGQVELTVSAVLDEQMADTTIRFEVTMDQTTVKENERKGSIHPSSSYGLAGDFSMYEEGDEIVIEFDETYNFNGAPGPYLYLRNSATGVPGDTDYEIGFVSAKSGIHTYRIPKNEVDINEYTVLYYYCKPFEIRLGYGEFEN